ncbi:hypothetical protein ScalyP_jg1886 [Parmales sp. scaly parma]|nr:hypothetical protein ScalyP_jg1886 [Parmales sp. scaly parma]
MDLFSLAILFTGFKSPPPKLSSSPLFKSLKSSILSTAAFHTLDQVILFLMLKFPSSPLFNQISIVTEPSVILLALTMVALSFFIMIE